MAPNEKSVVAGLDLDLDHIYQQLYDLDAIDQRLKEQMQDITSRHEMLIRKLKTSGHDPQSF
jgi:hypothetical protein